MAKAKSSKKIMRLVVILGTVLCCIILLLTIAYFGYQAAYTNKIYAGVHVAGIDMSGKDYTTAVSTLATYKANLQKTGLQFHYKDTDVSVPTTVDGVDLITIDADTTLHNAFAIGRSHTASHNLEDKLAAMFGKRNISVVYTIDRDSIIAQLEAQFSTYETAASDAKLQFSANDGLTVAPDSTGEEFNWDAVLDKVTTNITTLKPVDITLSLTPTPAQVTTAAAQSVQAAAKQAVALAPLSLTYDGDSYSMGASDVQTWLIAVNQSGKVVLGLNHDAVADSLASIAGKIDVPVQEGRFSLDQVDGKVKLTQFENGQDGLGVNVDNTIIALEKALFTDHQSTIPLAVEVTHPRANPENLDDLGITDLLGTGTTNFAGSPYNRVLNIRKGADMLNGLLVAPGEEFSLVSILKPIDLDHGWYSELVIKGDKLEKEAGGGLCQIGSTAFRAAMLSGLNITERRNHSWAISYYGYNGKAGVDATIYDPSPDFKFINDTGHYILWRTRIEGTNIYFELWGTSDGRKGSFTTPTNYNYVAPGPATETLDPNAKPGSRVCDSHGFTGVTASFDYTIERADGTKDVKNYTSIYKARPEACIVGPDVEPEPTPTPTPTNTNSSNSNTNSSSNTNTNTNTNSNKNSNTNSNKNKS